MPGGRGTEQTRLRYEAWRGQQQPSAAPALDGAGGTPSPAHMRPQFFRHNLGAMPDHWRYQFHQPGEAPNELKENMYFPPLGHILPAPTEPNLLTGKAPPASASEDPDVQVPAPPPSLPPAASRAAAHRRPRPLAT